MNSGHSSFMKAIQRGEWTEWCLLQVKSGLETKLENLPLVFGLKRERDLVCYPLHTFFFPLLNVFIICRSRMASFTSKIIFHTKRIAVCIVLLFIDVFPLHSALVLITKSYQRQCADTNYKCCSYHFSSVS